jgi:hypothetical protein
MSATTAAPEAARFVMHNNEQAGMAATLVIE